MEKIEEYRIKVDDLILNISILGGKGVTKTYFVEAPQIAPATRALLENLKHNLVRDVAVTSTEIVDPSSISRLKVKFKERAESILKSKIPNIEPNMLNLLLNVLMQEMLGLGEIEYFTADENLEEVVITSSKEPVRVYHKLHGWLETNITIQSEGKILNFANIIGRRVGRQITTLNPLLDAHLVTGDRSNAVLFPISTKGHTITIRKFARDPWTMTDFIKNKTCTPKLLALIWLSIQYEMNVLISGGTASGKTSFLNVIMPFIPPNHRIVSIEDTRELQLPKFLYWCPLTIRQPNPEGKGEVCMYPGSFIVDGSGELREISEYVEGKLVNGTGKTDCNVTAVEGDGDTILAGSPTSLTYKKEKIKMFSKILDRRYICEVVCQDGTSFKITENTKLPVATKDGRISLLTPFEIREKGGYIPIITKLNVDASKQRIQIFENFDRADIYACGIKHEYTLLENDVRKGFTLNEIARHCGVSRQSFRYYQKTGIVSIRVLKKMLQLSSYSPDYFEERIRQLKGKGPTASRVRVPHVVDEDVAYFAGFVLAEKFINRNRIIISQKADIYRIISNLAKKIFGLKITHKNDGSYHLYGIFSSVVAHLMHNLFNAKKSANISVPRIIMRSPDNIITAFLAGYIDGDGTINKGRVSLSSRNEEFVRECKYLFNRLGIMSSVYAHKNMHTLNILGRTDVKLACKLLHFKTQSKLKGVKTNLLADFKEGTIHNRIPYFMVRNHIEVLKKYLTEEERYKFYYRYAESEATTISLERLSACVSLLSQRVHTTPTEENSLKELSTLNNDVTYVKVKDVIITENKERIPSYDITPEHSKYFVAGTGNFTLVEDTMLDLLVNSLRMRPDRIVLGEMRKKDQAEVLFEAMHTGHSVYATVHADSVSETIQRLVNPPIEVPKNLLVGVNLNVVMFRDRRKGLRRVFQIGEFIPALEEGGAGVRPNILYRWKPTTDEIVEHSASLRLYEELSRHTGMTMAQIENDIAMKAKILEWMVKNNIRHVDDVGELMRRYYLDPDQVIETANAKAEG